MFLRCFGFIAIIASSLFLADNCYAMTLEQMENAAKGMRNVCIPKTGVDPAVVAGTRRGEFPEDEKLQCYLKCIMGLIKTMKNGRPVLEPILKQINTMMPSETQERSTAAAKTCAATLEFSDNACTAAWQFVKCQYEQAPEVFFFP